MAADDADDLRRRVAELEVTVERLVTFAQAAWAGAAGVVRRSCADEHGVHVE